MRMQENVALSSLTTMRLGGAARYVIEVENADEVRGAYTFAREKKLPVWVMGGGANTIAGDEGFSGVVILNKILGREIVAKYVGASSYDFSADVDEEFLSEICAMAGEGEDIVKANGGENWDDFVSFVVSKGYTGVEALAGIPGTVGAAPVQNIGAYGQEAGQTILAVDVFDSVANEYVTLYRDELEFAYRRSIFNSGATGRYFIISVYFGLKHGEISGELYASLQKYMDEQGISSREPAVIAEAVRAVRALKLPDPREVASAGSFFKNVYVSSAEKERLAELGVPVREEGDKLKVNTGYLVENSGLMGRDLHGFEINPEAALVLMNKSARTYKDLAAAREEIRAAVREKFGLELEQEPVEISGDVSGGAA